MINKIFKDELIDELIKKGKSIDQTVSIKDEVYTDTGINIYNLEEDNSNEVLYKK